VRRKATRSPSCLIRRVYSVVLTGVGTADRAETTHPLEAVGASGKIEAEKEHHPSDFKPPAFQGSAASVTGRSARYVSSTTHGLPLLEHSEWYSLFMV